MADTTKRPPTRVANLVSLYFALLGFFFALALADTTKRPPTRVATPNPQPTRVGQRTPGDGLPRGPLGEKAVPGATRVTNQRGEARTSAGGAGGTNSTPPKFTDRTYCAPLPASNQRQVGMRKPT